MLISKHQYFAYSSDAVFKRVVLQATAISQNELYFDNALCFKCIVFALYSVEVQQLRFRSHGGLVHDGVIAPGPEFHTKVIPCKSLSFIF